VLSRVLSIRAVILMVWSPPVSSGDVHIVVQITGYDSIMFEVIGLNSELKRCNGLPLLHQVKPDMMFALAKPLKW